MQSKIQQEMKRYDQVHLKGPNPKGQSEGCNKRPIYVHNTKEEEGEVLNEMCYGGQLN